MATAISSTTSANEYSYTKTAKGYAYNDEYGFAHVVKSLQTAQNIQVMAKFTITKVSLVADTP